MKNILVLSIAVLTFSFSAYGQKSCTGSCCSKTTKESASTNATQDTSVVLACKLTGEEQKKRSEELRATIFKQFEKVNELPDGVELIYADGKKYAPILVEFINTERACCPFFTFNLAFLPNSEKVSLTIGGSPQIKEIIKTMMN